MGVRSRSPAGDLYTQTVNTTAGGIPAANIPRAAMVAEGACKGPGTVLFTRDGTAPTATIGFPAYTDDIIKLNSHAEIDGYSGYAGTTSTIDWEFFTDLSG